MAGERVAAARHRADAALADDPRFDTAWSLLHDARGVGTPARMQEGMALVPLVLGEMRGVLVAPSPASGIDLDSLDTLQRLELLAVHASLCVAHVMAVRRDAELIARLRRSQVDLQRSQQRLVRTERMRALGDMAAGVAHDFNNVFNAILHRAALLHDAVSSVEVNSVENAGGHAQSDRGAARDRARGAARRRDGAAPAGLHAAASGSPRLRPGGAARDRGVGGGARRAGSLRGAAARHGGCAGGDGRRGELAEVVGHLLDNAVEATPEVGC